MYGCQNRQQLRQDWERLGQSATITRRIAQRVWSLLQSPFSQQIYNNHLWRDKTLKLNTFRFPKAKPVVVGLNFQDLNWGGEGGGKESWIMGLGPQLGRIMGRGHTLYCVHIHIHRLCDMYVICNMWYVICNMYVCNMYIIYIYILCNMYVICNM